MREGAAGLGGGGAGFGSRQGIGWIGWIGRIGRIGGRGGGELGLDLGVGGEEESELGRIGRVEAAKAGLVSGRLAAVLVELIGVLGAADCLEEHAREAGERAQPLG